MAETLICPVCRRPADASGRATCRCAEVEVLPRPVAQPDEGPDPADLAMFEKAGRADDDTSPLPAVAAAPRRRRRVGRGMALAVGGTALAVIGSGALVAGMFLGGDDPFDEARFEGRDGAPTLLLPSDAPGGESAEASPGGSASPSAPPPASPSASASPSQSRPPSSSPASRAPSTAPAAPGDGSPRPSSSPTAPDRDGGRDGHHGGGDWWDDEDRQQEPVLREGDSGPEVVELQYRLRQTYAYRGDVDGRYDGEVREGVARFQEWYGVRGDPEGVYGPHTRRALEGASRGR